MTAHQHIRIIAVAAALGGMICTTAAQTREDVSQMSLVELMNVPVTSSTKYAKSQHHSPSTVSVITSDEIRAYGYPTLWEALQTVVGSVPFDNGNTAAIGFRGIMDPSKFNSRILWLLDGHAMNDSYFQRHFPDYRFGVDIDNVKQIEIIRGPLSVLYGSNAFCGIVNVVTRTGEDINGLQVTPRIGGVLTSAGGYSLPRGQDPFNTYGGSISYGQKFARDKEVLLSASLGNNVGQYLYVPYFQSTRQGALAEKTDFRKAAYVFARGQYGELSLAAQFMSAKNGFPLAGYGSDPNSQSNHATLQRASVEAKHLHEWSSDFSTTTRLYMDDTEFDACWMYDGDPNLDMQRVPARAYGAEALARWNLSDHVLLGGVEFQHHQTSQREDYPSEGNYVAYDSYTFTNIAAFVQDDITLTSSLVLDLGLRYEANQNFGGVIVGKGALVYEPEGDLIFRLQYGGAFNNPLLHDYFYHSSVLNKRNDEIVSLERERARTIEFVGEYLSQRTTSQVSLFYSVFDRLIAATDEDYYANTSGVISYGVEGELKTTISRRAKAYVNMTLQSTKDQATKEPALNVPAYSLKCGSFVYVTETRDIVAALEGQFYGRMKYREVGSRPAVRFEQKPFVLIHANVHWQIFDQWSASLRLDNLFNTAYHYGITKGDVEGLAGNGRTYMIRLDWRL